MGRAFQVRAASMAKTAAAKSSLYAKWGKEIFAAAKSGVPDPNMNATLKRVIDRAKKEQVPAEVIKRAITKAEGVNSGSMSAVTYEGFGSGNVSIIVECLTDNVNRTVSDVRTCFNKTGGKMGVSGSVSHMFSRKAEFIFEGLNEEDVLEVLMASDCDVEDIHEEEGVIFITADTSYYEKIKEALLAAKEDLEFYEDGNNMVAAQYIDLDDESKEKFTRMLSMLREIDDVQDIYHNANDIEE